MGKKLFVTSDIHGHYTELIRALDECGFDCENPNHIFVCCGDLFDRGKENMRVYDFVKSLKHKILIRGNHEDYLCTILGSGDTSVYAESNGTDITVKELLGDVVIDANGCFDTTAHTKKIREIMDFVNSMQYYYETDDYVFTHGWLPIVFEGHYPLVDPAWRNASEDAWMVARVLEWQQLYGVKATLKGKTIVCGHRPARLGYMYDSFREPDCSMPFYGDGMIAIDAGTIRSGRVNVLVVEES
jgi:serine/threonine protein phosphatase 1